MRGLECQAHNFPAMHIRSNCFISSILFLLLSPQVCRSQTTPNTESTPQVRLLQGLLEGCYEVKLGRWWPWGFGEEDAYVKPPNRIQLLAQLGRRGFEQGRPLIRAIPRQEELPGSMESSFWSVKSQNQVTLSWTTALLACAWNLRNTETNSAVGHIHTSTRSSSSRESRTPPPDELLVRLNSRTNGTTS